MRTPGSKQRAVVALVATGAVLAMVGCGRSDREKVGDVAEQFATDLRENRGHPCSLLEGALADELGGDRCDARLRKMYAAEVGNGEVKVGRVYEDSAYTHAEAEVGDLQLSLNDAVDEWRIDVIGP